MTFMKALESIASKMRMYFIYQFFSWSTCNYLRLNIETTCYRAFNHENILYISNPSTLRKTGEGEMKQLMRWDEEAYIWVQFKKLASRDWEGKYQILGYRKWRYPLKVKKYFWSKQKTAMLYRTGNSWPRIAVAQEVPSYISW